MSGYSEHSSAVLSFQSVRSPPSTNHPCFEVNHKSKNVQNLPFFLPSSFPQPKAHIKWAALPLSLLEGKITEEFSPHQAVACLQNINCKQIKH